MKDRSFHIILLIVISSALLFMQDARAATPVGNNDSHTVVTDFERNWYVYDEEYKSYVPYISERHFNIPAHVVFCNLEQNLRYELLIKCEEANNFLFIEGALKRKLPVNEWLILPIDSLYQVYKKKQIYLTIYGSKDLDSKQVVIGHRVSNEATPGQKKNGEDILQILPRKLTPYQSSLSLLFLVTLCLFAYLSASYNRAFTGFFDLMGPFTVYSREQSLFASQALSRTNVLFIILLSLIFSLGYLLLKYSGLSLLGNKWFLQEGETLGILLANFFRLSILFFISLIGKYFFLGFLGGLFNLGKVVDLHYFKLIQTNTVFYSVFTVILFSMVMSVPDTKDIIKESLIYVLAIFYLMRTAIIFLTINRTMPIQILYLISYLCIVEILPIVIGLRLIV